MAQQVQGQQQNQNRNRQQPEVKAALALVGPNEKAGKQIVTCITTLKKGNKAWTQGDEAWFQIDGNFTQNAETVDQTGEAKQEIEVGPGEHLFRVFIKDLGIWSEERRLVVPKPEAKKPPVATTIEATFHGSGNRFHCDIQVWDADKKPVKGAEVRVQNKFQTGGATNLQPTDEKGTTFWDVRLTEEREIYEIWVPGTQAKTSLTFLRDRSGEQGSSFLP